MNYFPEDAPFCSSGQLAPGWYASALQAWGSTVWAKEAGKTSEVKRERKERMRKLKKERECE